jgi:hypothetical protein
MASQRARAAIVDPPTALRLFDLQQTASLKDLNLAYRRLVRDCHPDYNPERLSWAHEAMVKINAAYDVALEHLSSIRYEEIERRLDGEIRAHDRFVQIFLSVANSVLEGIYIYYQYGLENPFLRENGVPRFRYRLALKKVSSGIDQLQRLDSPNSMDRETADIFCSFAIAFLQCMRMNRSQDPSGKRTETSAYRHYRLGTQHLDSAIQKVLFGMELSGRQKPAAPHELSVAHAEFLTVLSEHGTSSWITEAAIKTYLLEAVHKLQSIAERIPELGIAQ